MPYRIFGVAGKRGRFALENGISCLAVAWLMLTATPFGIGAVVEGILWVLVISVALIAAAVFLGWRKVRGVLDDRPR